MVSYEQAKRLKDEFADDYRKRQDAFKNLRRYWHGDYWHIADTENKSLVSVFRDLTSRTSDVGPDVKLVHNVVQQVVNKYQALLSPLPQIRVYTDPPESDLKRKQATLKQRYLYGCWAAGDMAEIFNKLGWYLPLMGHCYLGIIPDFDRKLPKPMLRSPENAFPILGFDGSEKAVIFSWKVRESAAKRDFAKYITQSEKQGLVGRVVSTGMRRDTDPVIEVLEYSDATEWHRWVDGQEVNGAVHKYGFNLWQPLKFINVPDEPWGHGAVEQAVNLNEMGNALYSLMFQAVLENVFPRLVLIDPMKGPEEIETGPGAIIPINAGGAVEWLHPPTQVIGAQEQFLGYNERNIKQATGMPGGASWGESPASSIVTGKSVEALQEAGTGSMVEMVQGTGIGSAIVKWNEYAVYIGQKAFAKEKLNVFGTEIDPLAINPRQFAESFRGNQLIGSSRNEVIFSPALDLHTKLVMWLQAKGGGLVSDKYIREQIAIPDSAAMDEEILVETIEKAVLGAYITELQAEPTAENAASVEKQAVGYLEGATPSAPTFTPPPGGAQGPPQGPPGAGAPPAGGGPPVGPLGGGGQAISPALPLPPGSPPPAGADATGPTASAPTQGTSLDDVVAAIQDVSGIQGRVFLVGEIVQTGQASGEIEVALTNMADQQALSQLPYQFVFHHVRGVPSEPHVEATPGKPSGR